MGEDQPQKRLNFWSKGTVLAIVLLSSMMRVYLASAIGMGVMVSLVEFAGNLLFGLLFLRKERLGQAGLIVLAILNLLYFGFRTLVFGELILGVYEALISFVLLLMLLGTPTAARIYSGAALYAVATLSGIGVSFFAFPRGAPTNLAMEAQGVDRFQSLFSYEVALKGLPWRVLSPEQAAALFGIEPHDVDLRLIRDDGSAFGLFFPIQFGNTPFHPELGLELEHEIRDHWFSSLSDWGRVEREDGFLLSALGESEGTSLAYVISYKHFGNFGVYALFWSSGSQRTRLVQESEALYSATEAPPIKERLQKLSAEEILHQNGGAQIRLASYDRSGRQLSETSGFNISPLGLIVTELAPLLNGERVEIAFPDGRRFDELSIVAVGRPEANLAVVSVKGENLPTIQALKSVDVSEHDAVFLIDSGPRSAAKRGSVTAVRLDGTLTLYDLSLPASVGAPVFNEFGETIAMVRAGDKGPTSLTLDEFTHLFLLPTPLSLREFRQMIQ